MGLETHIRSRSHHSHDGTQPTSTNGTLRRPLRQGLDREQLGPELASRLVAERAAIGLILLTHRDHAIRRGAPGLPHRGHPSDGNCGPGIYRPDVHD